MKVLKIILAILVIAIAASTITGLEQQATAQGCRSAAQCGPTHLL